MIQNLSGIVIYLFLLSGVTVGTCWCHSAVTAEAQQQDTAYCTKFQCAIYCLWVDVLCCPGVKAAVY